MRRVEFQPDARGEFEEALEFYEARRPGLRLELLNEVDSLLGEAARHPGRFPRVGAECRRAVLRRFPFVLVIRTEDDVLVVESFHHTSRRPRSW